MPYQGRYKFDKKKVSCPSCEKKKRFSRYYDSHTGKLLPSQYGKCDRQNSCTYWLNPEKDGYSLNVCKQELEQERERQGYEYHKALIKPPKPKPLVFYPEPILRATHKDYRLNSFIQNLAGNVPYPFEVSDIERAIVLYQLGTVSKGYMTGAVTFPFIDRLGNVRAIQAKLFDKANHTVKGRTSNIHAMIKQDCEKTAKPLPYWLTAYLENDRAFSCLFGEHLLNQYPNKPIALVEAPKTAIYGALYFGMPEQLNSFLWLAVYNMSSLTIDRCKVLEGREVVLFPDLSKDGNAYQHWSDKAQRFNLQMPNANFKVSDLLEQYAPKDDKEQGADLADYLIQMDWRRFRQEQPQDNGVPTMPKSEKQEKSEPKKNIYFLLKAYKDLLHYENGLLMADGYPATWDLTAPYIDEQTKALIRAELKAMPKP